MQLYTSLVRLKQEMNGGVLPPMTPISGAALAMIDPAFTIGMGALEEHATLGLRCPVRGCGKYFAMLHRHLDFTHVHIGGADAILAALSIPRTAPLVSQKTLARISAASSQRAATPEGRQILLSASRVGLQKSKRKGGRGQHWTMGARNLRNQCERQLKHRFIDLQNVLGRSPSYNEAGQAWGYGTVEALVSLYGSWNAAKATFGLTLCVASRERGNIGGTIRFEREAVLESLFAYYQQHGNLPSVYQARKPMRAPLVPCVKTICRSLGTQSWTEAMRRAAALLDIHGGRYGLPVRSETAA